MRKVKNYCSRIFRVALLAAIPVGYLGAQPAFEKEFDGLSKPQPGQPNAPKSEFPKLGDYVELDDAIKNEMYGTIDFPNAELKDIIKAISKLANKNFILDRKIENKKVTIISPQAVTKQEAYNAFLSALYMNDLTIVSMGKFLKIIESKSAIQNNIRVFYGDNVPASEEIITSLYKLNYLNVEEIQRYLNDLIARSGRVSFYPNTNTLVMTDTGLNIRKLISILKQIDVPGHEDQLENIPIRYASAKGISSLVGEILDAQSGTRRGGGSGANRNQPQKTRGGGIITKIVPDERTNSLVVLANGRGVQELKSLVSKLDTPDAAGGGNIHIYYCKNAVAEELAKTITSLISGATKSDTKSANRPGDPANTASTPPLAGGGRGGEESIKFEGNIKVTSDKPTNSLVVVASGSDFASLKSILQKLDSPRRQVYVETTIMEIDVTNASESGVGVNYALPGLPQAAGYIPSVGVPSLSTLVSTPAGVTGLVASITGGRKVDVSVGGSTVSISSITGLIKAMQTSRQANILHQPQILTSDNEEASIEVKNRIAVEKGTTLVGTAAVPQKIFDKEEVTISLKITPQIGKDNDLIRLNVDQQIDDFQKSNLENQIDTNQRKAKTMIVVRNGDTVVVGGLQRNITTDTTDKFPLLGDLPILGWLFKGKSSRIQKSNLILFLTPHIINEYSDLMRITQEKVESREDFGKKLFDPSDRLSKEVKGLTRKIKKDREKSAPRGWNFKNSEDSSSVESNGVKDDVPMEESSTSAYIQPSVPEKTTPVPANNRGVEKNLRSDSSSRSDSYSPGGFASDKAEGDSSSVNAR
jgi:general secretion pathway protein D